MKMRSQREQELIAMMRTDRGLDEILSLYRKAIGMPEGTCPPVGTLVGHQMIPAILRKEFPDQQ